MQYIRILTIYFCSQRSKSANMDIDNQNAVQRFANHGKVLLRDVDHKFLQVFLGHVRRRNTRRTVTRS